VKCTAQKQQHNAQCCGQRHHHQPVAHSITVSTLLYIHIHMCRGLYRHISPRGGHSHICCSHSRPCSWPHILRKGWSCYTFFHILSGQGQNVRVVKRLINKMQHSQTVKSLFMMRSSGRAAKTMGKNFDQWPRS